MSCMRAEARVLNLGRTSWHYDGGRRETAARPPQSRWCARVSDRVAGRAMPDFSKASPTPPTDASRAFAGVVSRAASRRHCPRVAPPWRHTLSTRTVRPTGTCRAPATLRRGCCEAKMARPPPCFADAGQGGACSRSARNRRSPPLPRPEQRQVDGSPLSRGRRDHCRSPMTRGPVTADGLAAPLRPARRRAAPPPDDY